MADKIVAEYTVKVDKALKDLNKLAARVDKVDDERKKVQNGFKDMSTGLNSAFKKLGATIAATFALDRIVDFGKEAVKLASQMDGVERAFRRIGGANSDQLLQGLRNATRGTVSDLQLMQKAVQASNFKIPLESLARLFKFAQARARETGESVEYLTNSIVLGIGRKSPLILDNLGISAVELRARLKGVGIEAANVGDIAEIIGDIAEEELAKMGDQSDTTADKMEQLAASTENLKAALGSLITETAEPALDFFTKLSTAISNDITEFSRFKESLKGESGLSLLNKLTEETTKLTELETEATEKAGKVRDAEFNKIKERVDFQRRLVGAIKEELDARVSNSVEQEITVDLINKETEAYRKLLEEQNKSIVTISSLQAQLKDLQKSFKDIEIGSDEWYNQLEKIRLKTQEVEDATTLMKATLNGSGVDEPIDADWFDLENADMKGAEESIEMLTDLYLRRYPESVKEGTDIAEEIFREHFERLMQMQNESFENDKRNQQENFELGNTLLQSYLQLYSTFTRMAATMTQQQYNYELSLLQERLDKEQISREQYERQRANLARENFRKQKEFSITQAIINTALGVTNAFATAPNIILGAVLAGTVAAVGAAEIATIASQPVPKFAEGGFVNEHGEIKGRKHAQGGVVIEAEGNEFITKGKYAQQNADILKAINSGQWEKYKMENIIAPAINQVLEGGFENMGASYVLNTGWTDKNLLRQGDRNRYAMRDGFVYLGDRMEKALNRKSKNRYV